MLRNSVYNEKEKPAYGWLHFSIVLVGFHERKMPFGTSCSQEIKEKKP